jgi:hypothetical protein
MTTRNNIRTEPKNPRKPASPPVKHTTYTTAQNKLGTAKELATVEQVLALYKADLITKVEARENIKRYLTYIKNIRKA